MGKDPLRFREDLSPFTTTLPCGRRDWNRTGEWRFAGHCLTLGYRATVTANPRRSGLKSGIRGAGRSLRGNGRKCLGVGILPLGYGQSTSTHAKHFMAKNEPLSHRAAPGHARHDRPPDTARGRATVPLPMIRAGSTALQVDTVHSTRALASSESGLVRWDVSENRQRVRILKLTPAGRKHLADERRDGSSSAGGRRRCSRRPRGRSHEMAAPDRAPPGTPTSTRDSHPLRHAIAERISAAVAGGNRRGAPGSAASRA